MPSALLYVQSQSLCLRSSFDDLLRGFISVLLEVLVEQLAELRDLVLEISGSGPAFSWVEKLVRHVGACLRDVQVEDIVRLVLRLGQLAIVNGVKDGARILPISLVSMSLIAGRRGKTCNGHRLPES